MRWLVLLLAGCSFAPRLAANDASAIDASGERDAPDAAVAPDAPPPDAAMPDAPKLAQITYVQGTTTFGDAAVSQLMLSQAVVAGDLCVIGIGISGGSITSVTDSAGNMFTRVSNATSESVYVAANMHASANDMITVTYAGPTGFTAATAVYRGLATASPVDGTAAGSGNGTALDSGALATAHPHDLLVGLASSNGATAAGSGFSAHVGGMFSMIEDQEVSTASSYHATATATTDVVWDLVEVALKAAD